MQVTQLFIGYVGSMLQQYAHNPEQNWKAKDCAIYLVMALTVRGKTAAQGATATNQLVNVMDFFSQHILPELQSQQLDQRPVLKADALKYLTTFRSQIPKETCVQVSIASACGCATGLASVCIVLTYQPTMLLQIFQQLGVLLGSEANVVHTYAAVAVERLLAQKVSISLKNKCLGVSHLQALHEITHI